MKLDAASSPEGAELKKESIEFSIGNGTQLPPMAQFIWNDKRFLVAGSRIFSLADGKMEPFLSGLPTENGNIVRVSIFLPNTY